MQDKSRSIRDLEKGLQNECADEITEVIINLDDGTCDYVELIPILERIAEIDLFCYFDDNGAGGYPRADHRQQTSFKWQALKAIKNIRENALFEADSPEARALKSNSNELIKHTLKRLAANPCTDKKLIPILEKIARKDVYSTYSYYAGFKKKYQFAEMANNAIQKILETCET